MKEKGYLRKRGILLLAVAMLLCGLCGCSTFSINVKQEDELDKEEEDSLSLYMEDTLLEAGIIEESDTFICDSCESGIVGATGPVRHLYKRTDDTYYFVYYYYNPKQSTDDEAVYTVSKEECDYRYDDTVGDTLVTLDHPQVNNYTVFIFQDGWYVEEE